MNNRLGNVVYWTACGGAILLIALGGSSLRWGDGGLRLFSGPLILVFATAIWLLGRTVKYILG
jgi:hypothetical protein